MTDIHLCVRRVLDNTVLRIITFASKAPIYTVSLYSIVIHNRSSTPFNIFTTDDNHSVLRMVQLLTSQYLSVEFKEFIKDYFTLSLICMSVASFSMISILSHRFPPLKHFLLKNYVCLMGIVLFLITKLLWINYSNSARQLFYSNTSVDSYSDPTILFGFIALLSAELTSLHLMGVLSRHMIEKSVFATMNIAGLCLSLWLMTAKAHYVNNCVGYPVMTVDEEYRSYHDVAVYFSLSSFVVSVVAMNGLSLTLFNYNVVDRSIKAFMISMNIAVSSLSTIASLIVQYIMMPLIPLLMKCLRWLGIHCWWLWSIAIRPFVYKAMQVCIRLVMIIYRKILELVQLLDRNCIWLWNKVVHPTKDAVVRLCIHSAKIIHNAAVTLYEAMTCSYRWLWNTVIHPFSDTMLQALVTIDNALRRSTVAMMGWLDICCRWIWDSVIRPITTVMMNIYYLQRICAFTVYKLVLQDMCFRWYLTTVQYLIWLWQHYIKHVVVCLKNICACLTRIIVTTIYYFLLPSLMLCIAADGIGLVGSIFVDTHRISMVPVGLFLGGTVTMLEEYSTLL